MDLRDEEVIINSSGGEIVKRMILFMRAREETRECSFEMLLLGDDVNCQDHTADC